METEVGDRLDICRGSLPEPEEWFKIKPEPVSDADKRSQVLAEKVILKAEY